MIASHKLAESGFGGPGALEVSSTRLTCKRNQLSSVGPNRRYVVVVG